VEDITTCGEYKKWGHITARDYMLTGLYANQDVLREAYENFHGIINDYVETIFSDVQKIQKTGKNMMDMTEIPYHDYPERMMPLIHHHYSEKSKFFSSENITHYIRASAPPLGGNFVAHPPIV
jgi:hypothetical protein